MAILRERVSWRKPRAANSTRRSTDLTPEEQANVRVALRFLRTRYGSWWRFAQAIDARWMTLRDRAGGRTVSGGLALRVAKAAGVPVEDVLVGRWPIAGACPYCGRY
jgi:hypothetical protein